MKNTLIIIFLLALTVMLASINSDAVETQKPSGYHLLKKLSIEGDGFWDYLTIDTTSRLLYIAHGNQMEIVNVDRWIKESTITMLNGVHGVALVPSIGRGYISNGRNDTVTVFDLKTRQRITDIPTGANPDAILYDPFSKKVFTFNGRSANTSVIDIEKNKVVGTLALGGKPEFAVTDEKGKIFVNIEDTSELVVFDPKELKELHRWKLAPCEEPSGLAYDAKNQRLFSVCSNRLMVVINAETGAIITNVPIGDRTDGVKFDPGTRLIFSSNGEGTLTIIHQDSPDKYSVQETITTKKGCRTLAVDPTTHHVFVVTADFGPTPKATKERPDPRPPALPGTFTLFEYSK
jgi:YVTN family beta-propeller protein